MQKINLAKTTENKYTVKKTHIYLKEITHTKRNIVIQFEN